jgi:glycine/D-amino acid oxidase-like deaminating enzyme
VPYCVNAGMQSVQPPTCNPVADRVAAQANLRKLPPRHNPMLPTGQRGHRPVPPTSLQAIGYKPYKCGLVGHGVMVSPPASQVVRSG